ncbi:MAG TPA: oligopeptide/dipeptide ABC transporter ATP-binding protein [Pseudomonas sp.]|uniref:ABC transporter ATP-binding protein n=1 Tax=Pseudomonas sp. TaxID=306 RepID=UPI002B459788|nr:oligopeptide/dipeptide ABC transporter ATP-binding protein [Pseudomonas sp.]HKS13614.1 oligopeptide/dipeptide ABC transporter ATP-binding protein [Pseudomonas sp.]
MTLLHVDRLTVDYPLRGKQRLKAVNDVSLTLEAGRTLALVGESGCGKSSLGHAIAGLRQPTEGRVVFQGQDLTRLLPHARRTLAAHLQLVFQDPAAALNPRMSIASSIAEPLVIHGIARRERERRVAELLERVGLSTEAGNRTPHALSGGQRQRAVIARALALSPRLLICDEPVSALDTSIRAQILNLLIELQDDLGLAYLFISHDMAVVRHIADEVAVMYAGRIVEQAPTDRLFSQPRHPYTQSLMAAILPPDPRHRIPVQPLMGEVPSRFQDLRGCAFSSRCSLGDDGCAGRIPELTGSDATHRVACLLAEGDLPSR